MYKLFLAIFAFCLSTIQAQQLRQPFDFPILLSGNFGELRNNHFHSGIDFKTQGVEGKAVHAVQDGYISRISVSPWGYGNALYLTHPDGTTTVYGHLQQFIPSIAQYVKDKQYEQESFHVNLSLTPEEFPFRKGEIIA
ncbi:MAG: M23 family metallopeptidase, partial [Parabacteroides sp.]|nr:M23 family metallopeptidase [Parabacteroides sp.]